MSEEIQYAFPGKVHFQSFVAPNGDVYSGTTQDVQGMTLRQWYAGLAMQIFLDKTFGMDSISNSKLAAGSFEVADAMLKEASK